MGDRLPSEYAGHIDFGPSSPLEPMASQIARRSFRQPVSLMSGGVMVVIRSEDYMADIVAPEIRSRIMSRVGGKNTKPEIALRRALHGRGFRFRLHVKELPGKPDIVLPKWGAILLVHGCFWHRHAGCPKATTPSSNTAFWERKFQDNVQRDRKNLMQLATCGWRIGVVWECCIGKTPEKSLVDGVVEFVTTRNRSREEWPKSRCLTAECKCQ